MARQIDWTLSNSTHSEKTEAPASPRCQPGVVSRKIVLRVITPIFTTVASAQSCEKNNELPWGDPVTPIRPTEIRSQLRFWWRATMGAKKCTTVEDLRKHEWSIWGGPVDGSDESPASGQVSLRVGIPKENNSGWKPGYTVLTQQGTALAYILWPFNMAQKGPRIVGLSNLKFDLYVTHPKALVVDVDAAIWAWSVFGGLGGRCRRGCGSLGNKGKDSSGKDFLSTSPDLEKVKSSLQTRLTQYCSTTARSWPTLSPLVLLGNGHNTALDAWINAVECMRDFRQGINVAREPSGKNGTFPGATHWPEAEAIRVAGKKRAPRLSHQIRPGMPADYFPRAEFGMPLGFPFATLPGDADPHQVLPNRDGEIVDRMASPLIVKSAAIQTNDQFFFPLIARLVCSEQCNSVAAVSSTGKTTATGNVLDPMKANELNVPEMKTQGSGSAVDAFWKWTQKERRFTEVRGGE